MIEKGFLLLGVNFSKRLALASFEEHGGNPVIQYVHYDHKNSWRADFFGPQLEVQLLRESSPLTPSGSLYRFIHRSILEYFFSRTIFDPSTLGDSDGFCLQSNFGSCEIQPLDPNSPLFTRDPIKEPPDFEKQLHDVIELSKTNTSAATAAANAITILVRAGTFFHRTDLQGIRILGADLSGGQFDSTHLQGADLRGVNFTKSWLRQANLTRTQLEGVRLGELPYLKEEDEVTACAYSSDGSNYCTVQLWDCAEGEKLIELKEGYDDDVFVVFSPCGKRVASGCGYGDARIWNAQTGETEFLI
ncbi:hypothetical protein BGZ96_009499, partial [Linnemannia gamsii]